MRPILVAELSANHNGSLETAFELMEKFAASGADAFKLQTYTASTMTFDRADAGFFIESGNWKGRSLFNLYEEAHTPWDWHKALFDKGRELGIPVFSSPFDETAVDFLEELDCPIYKIASFENQDTELIAYAAKTGKPMVISTGMADSSDIERAVQVAKDSGCKDLTILHCVSSYPAEIRDFNLTTISDMQEKFGVKVGLSDHSLGDLAATVATSLGAVMIEKHVTLDPNGGGPDDAFSMTPEQFAVMRGLVDQAFSALGGVFYGITESEKGNAIFKRSIYFSRDLRSGQIISEDDLVRRRPALGLPAFEIENLVGRTLSRDVSAEQPATWDAIV